MLVFHNCKKYISGVWAPAVSVYTGDCEITIDGDKWSELVEQSTSAGLFGLEQAVHRYVSHKTMPARLERTRREMEYGLSRFNRWT